MKEAFPESVKVRRRLSGAQEKREIVYNNIKVRSSVTIHSEEQQVLFPDTSPIDNIKKAIERLHNEQVVIQTQLQNETQKIKDDWNTNYIRLLLERFKAVNADIQKYTDGLTNLYEKEIVQFVDSQKELSVKSKREIQTEVQEFEKTLKLGLRTEAEIKIDGTLFANLSQTLREQCPLIYEIVETLLLTTSEGWIATGRRIHSASHALAILCSLKSQRLSNDFKLLFTILCISFGAGMRFVNVLNHVGFTVSWKTAMEVLDERMQKMQDHIKKLTPVDTAIILLMDNINIYKGKRKHLRIFKELTPAMWNFTGRALLIHHLSESVKAKLQKEELCLKSQKNVLALSPEDIVYSKDNEQDIVFENYKDYYLLSAMEKAYNGLPLVKKKLAR